MARCAWRNALLLARGGDGGLEPRVAVAAIARLVPDLELGRQFSVRQVRLQEVAQLGVYASVAGVFALLSLLLVALGTFANASNLVSKPP